MSTPLAQQPDVAAKHLMKNRKHINWGLVSMILPVVAFFLVFNYAPMVGLVIAFQDYLISAGILGSSWVGLDNFARLFGSDDFPRAIRNTFMISLLRLAFGFFAPILLALMLNELRIELYKRSVQTLTYLPHFFSWVILGGIFLMVFGNGGPVNQIIQSFGGEPVGFLTSNFWFIVILVTTGIWQSAGWGAIIYLASLSGISPQLYEAAKIDGANRWQQTLHVTLPCLVPTMITLFVLSLGGIMTAGFDQVYNMYNPLVYDVSDIVETYVLRRLFGLEFSLATSAGLFQSGVGLIMIVGANYIARKMSKGEQGVW